MRGGPDASHPEGHLAHRAGWLRAAVLGANDGLVSTSSLMVGVATASGARVGAVLTAGFAGLAAGAMAMAAGEWVSVSSQGDVERADLAREQQELDADPQGELAELVEIYRGRGLSRELAERVADELSAGDRLAVHARDELGQSPASKARPGQAALASASSFSLGGAVPLLGMLGPFTGVARIAVIVTMTLIGLVVAGVLGARASGTSPLRPVSRVVVGGSAAMAVTALVGHLAGIAGG